jgi:hypothetical protein
MSKNHLFCIPPSLILQTLDDADVLILVNFILCVQATAHGENSHGGTIGYTLMPLIADPGASEAQNRRLRRFYAERAPGSAFMNRQPETTATPCRCDVSV